MRKIESKFFATMKKCDSLFPDCFWLALAAVACAGLAEPNHWFMRATITITCLLFTFTAVRAISLVGRDRVFAIVFSIAGVAYLAASMTGAGRYLFTNYPLALLAMTKQLTVPIGPIRYSRPISSGDALDEIISGAYIVSGDSTPIARMFLIGHCAGRGFLRLSLDGSQVPFIPAAAVLAMRNREQPHSKSNNAIKERSNCRAAEIDFVGHRAHLAAAFSLRTSPLVLGDFCHGAGADAWTIMAMHVRR